jgi:LytS/YehU family sensor histidine kinase
MFFYNLLVGTILVFIHLLLLSFGFYGWTCTGIELQVYTQVMQINLLPGGLYDELIFEALELGEKGILSTLFFGVAYLLYNNFRLKQVTQRQLISMREAELNYLKSQTNPHFLFNTLNNIYVLATEKSDIAPDAILRLSKILRFMIYETGSKFITIEQELEIIKDYITLEKLRYDESLTVSFDFNIQDMQARIRPLLLIPLIENAFKHGVSENIGEPFVNIKLSQEGQQLTLVVHNSSEQLDKNDKKGSIGLANLKRQLQLLYSDYVLTIQEGETMFTVTLRINLTSDLYD